MFLGTIVNVLSITAGCAAGLLFKKGIPEKMGNSIMYGMALCVMYIGISGALKGENVLIAVISIAIGAVIGELIDIDKYINKIGQRLEDKFSGGKASGIAKGFVTSSLLYCVGAMAIVGSLQSGLTGNHETLFAKSLIDAITAVVLTASMGIGVIFSTAAVFIYQGSITLLSGVIAPLLTNSVINEMTCVGSLLIIGLSLNMLKITNLNIMNYIPAVFIPIILSLFIK